MARWLEKLGDRLWLRKRQPTLAQHYEKIANYMREFTTEVATNHADHVPVLIWFAWSDNMRNAGMVKSDGSEKPHIFEVFKQVRDRTIL